MKALAAYSLDQFRHAMVATLRANHPDRLKELAEDRLLGIVDSGIEKASKYEIVTCGDIESFLDLMMYYGEDFDGEEWARGILAGSQEDGSAKIGRLEEYDLFARRDDGWAR